MINQLKRLLLLVLILSIFAACGKKEKEKGCISLKLRGNKNVYDVGLDDFISKLKKEISGRSLTLSY